MASGLPHRLFAVNAVRATLYACLAVSPLLAQDPAGLRPARPELLRIERSVAPGAAGGNRLDIDVPLLVGGAPFEVRRESDGAGAMTAVATGGLTDLRLYDRGGQEVPYLLVSPRPLGPRWATATLLPVARTDTTSAFEADLGAPHLVSALRVFGLPAPFLKRVRLEGSGDRAHWTLLVDEGTLFDLPDERLQQTELEFVAGNYRYLRLTWDDRNSGRMSMPDAVSARLAPAGAAAFSLRASIPFERRASEPRVSRYRLRLPGARLPIVAIELSVRDGNVLREARVSEPRLAGGQVAPFPLGTATLRRAVRGNVAASSLRIPINEPTEAVLDLVIDDGDNPPLDITGVTALFATLPYIYFESASADALTARFGGDRIAAPRYDLEAQRERVPSMKLAAAHWGEIREGVATVTPTGAPLPAVGAPIDARAFRWRRTIPEGPNGLTAVALDAAVLAHSRRFDDLRIATRDGRQVPFLLERLAEPLALDLGPVEQAPSDRPRRTNEIRSLYRVKMPYGNLPASRLVLTTSARVFQRTISVEVRRPAGGSRRDPWLERVAFTTWTNADPESTAPALTIDLPSLPSTDVVLAVDEGDNSRLPIASMSLLLPAYRVRFVRDGAESLTLLYGRTDLAQPTYDLALLAPRLIGAPASEVAAGPEQSVEAPAMSALPMTIFWAILGLAVVAMLVLIVRLVSKGGPSDPEPIVPETGSTTT